MNKRRLVVLIVLIIVISIILIVSFSTRRLEMEIVAKSSDTFGIDDHYYLSRMTPLYNSPYIFCLFSTPTPAYISGSPKSYLQKNAAIVVDIARSHQVLKIEWTNDLFPPVDGSYRSYRYSMAFALDSKPYICLEYWADHQIRWLDTIQRKYPRLQWLNRFFTRSSRKLLSIDSDGVLHDPSLFPFFMFPPTQGNDSIIGIFSSTEKVGEYEMIDGKLQRTFEWEGIDMPSQRIALDDGSYFGTTVRNQGYWFYKKNPNPATREISSESLCALIPTISSPLDLTFVSLFNHSDKPSMTYVSNVPGYPVFEIRSDNLDTGKISDIFKLIGNDFEEAPFASMQNNEALLLSTGTIAASDFIRRDQSVFISKREKNPDGTLGRFSNGLTPLEFPEDAQVCRYPLDDEHLIYYYEGRIWTVRWDGTSKTPVFPLID